MLIEINIEHGASWEETLYQGTRLQDKKPSEKRTMRHVYLTSSNVCQNTRACRKTLVIVIDVR